MFHLLTRRGFDTQAQIGGIAIGAADTKLFDFKAAIRLNHLVENLLHNVGIDQMAFGLHHFLLHG